MKKPITTYKIVFTWLFLVALSVPANAAITPEDQAIPRLVQLSKIPTAASVNEVIALAQEGSTNQMRLQFVMTALIQIGSSTAGDAYVKGILDNANSPAMSVKGGLVYLAQRPEPWMNPYAEKFLATTYDGETRCMAAKLAGALGLTTSVNIIEQIISTSSYDTRARAQAAYGLANLIPVANFTPVIDATDIVDWDKSLAKKLNVFLQANDTDKAAQMGQILKRSEFIFPLAGMRYILQTNNTTLLKQYVVQGNSTSITIPSKAHQLFIRMLGYQITGNINSIVISKISAL
jgi:hypothetical protein